MDEGIRFVEVELGFLQKQPWWPKPGDAGLVTIDFGCGPARLLCSFGDALGQGSVGFDVSEGMLSVANRRAQELGLDDIVTFSKLDGTKNGAELEELAGQVDLAMVVVVLHHTMEPKTIFENLCQTVKPGGHLLVCEFEEELPQSTFESWMEPFGFHITDSHDELMTMRKFTKPIKMTIAERRAD